MSALTPGQKLGPTGRLGYHRRVRILRLAPACVVLLGACAPALSTFTPAPVAPHQHFRGATALGVSIPTGSIGEAFDTAEKLAEAVIDGRALTDDEVGDLFESTSKVLVNLPSVNYELQGRYGIVKYLDLGLRLALPGAIRLDGRYQFLRREGSDFAASVGLGLTYYSLEIPVPSPIDEVIEIEDFTRYELDIPLLFGWSSDIGHVWFGPKLVLTSYSVSMNADLGTEIELGSISGTGLYYGVQIGGAIGYKYVWVAAELTIAGLSGSEDLEVPALAIKRSSSLGGAVFYPAFGLILQF